MLYAKKLLGLETRRYSALCRRILEEYAQTGTFLINGVEYTGAAVPRLLIEWCTNREIRGTRNFLVVRDGVAIFGFHDHPREFWAADTEFEFVHKLAAEKIIRVGHPPTQAQVAASRRSALGCFLVLGLVAIGLVALALVLWRVAAD